MKKTNDAVSKPAEAATLDTILAGPRRTSASELVAPAELILAQIVELASDGVTVAFEFAGQQHRLLATTTISLSAADLGRAAVLSFLNGQLNTPVVLGLVHQPLTDSEVSSSDCLELSANKELVLRCGDASLRLNSDGKIEIRSKNLTSRADQTHRILGGSVQIN